MRRIRRFLTPSVAKTIATSLIGSKLDYCYSVLFNVTEKEISKLQGVQNCLARVVTKSPRFCHITPLLKSLHWLPVCYRIKFKLCSLTCQALTSGQPVYIRNMLQLSRKVRILRSSDLDQLNVPRVRTAVGSWAFSVAAHRLWNELPLEIRSAKTQFSFRKKLKTYFFGQAFPTLILGGPVGPDDKRKRFLELWVELRLCLSRLRAWITEDSGAIEVYYYYYYYYYY